MAEVIELAQGEAPRACERHALVWVSAKPPKEGASTQAHKFGQTFFADEDDHDVSIMLGRARVWASQNNIATIYVQRDKPR